MTRAKHDKDWLQQAFDVAARSPHPTVKVGAVLVDARGREIGSASNGFATGVDNRAERFRDGGKSDWMDCAEELAIARAARRGKKTKGATLYATLELCNRCAGATAEAGIKRVCVPTQSLMRYPQLKQKWHRHIENGRNKLVEAGISIIQLDL